jgi:hypothetical protein
MSIAHVSYITYALTTCADKNYSPVKPFTIRWNTPEIIAENESVC